MWVRSRRWQVRCLRQTVQLKTHTLRCIRYTLHAQGVCVMSVMDSAITNAANLYLRCYLRYGPLPLPVPHPPSPTPSLPSPTPSPPSLAPSLHPLFHLVLDSLIGTTKLRMHANVMLSCCTPLVIRPNHGTTGLRGGNTGLSEQTHPSVITIVKKMFKNAFLKNGCTDKRAGEELNDTFYTILVDPSGLQNGYLTLKLHSNANRTPQ